MARIPLQDERSLLNVGASSVPRVSSGVGSGAFIRGSTPRVDTSAALEGQRALQKGLDAVAQMTEQLIVKREASDMSHLRTEWTNAQTEVGEFKRTNPDPRTWKEGTDKIYQRYENASAKYLEKVGAGKAFKERYNNWYQETRATAAQKNIFETIEATNKMGKVAEANEKQKYLQEGEFDLVNNVINESPFYNPEEKEAQLITLANDKLEYAHTQGIIRAMQEPDKAVSNLQALKGQIPSMETYYIDGKGKVQTIKLSEVQMAKQQADVDKAIANVKRGWHSSYTNAVRLVDMNAPDDEIRETLEGAPKFIKNMVESVKVQQSIQTNDQALRQLITMSGRNATEFEMERAKYDMQNRGVDDSVFQAFKTYQNTQRLKAMPKANAKYGNLADKILNSSSTRTSLIDLRQDYIKDYEEYSPQERSNIEALLQLQSKRIENEIFKNSKYEKVVDEIRSLYNQADGGWRHVDEDDLELYAKRIDKDVEDPQLAGELKLMVFDIMKMSLGNGELLSGEVIEDPNHKKAVTALNSVIRYHYQDNFMEAIPQMKEGQQNLLIKLKANPDVDPKAIVEQVLVEDLGLLFSMREGELFSQVELGYRGLDATMLPMIERSRQDTEAFMDRYNWRALEVEQERRELRQQVEGQFAP